MPQHGQMPFYSAGRGFESLRARQIQQGLFRPGLEPETVGFGGVVGRSDMHRLEVSVIENLFLIRQVRLQVERRSR